LNCAEWLWAAGASGVGPARRARSAPPSERAWSRIAGGARCAAAGPTDHRSPAPHTGPLSSASTAGERGTAPPDSHERRRRLHVTEREGPELIPTAPAAAAKLSGETSQVLPDPNRVDSSQGSPRLRRFESDVGLRGRRWHGTQRIELAKRLGARRRGRSRERPSRAAPAPHGSRLFVPATATAMASSARAQCSDFATVVICRASHQLPSGCFALARRAKLWPP
jgi:hypothetical protein